MTYPGAVLTPEGNAVAAVAAENITALPGVENTVFAVDDSTARWMGTAPPAIPSASVTARFTGGGALSAVLTAIPSGAVTAALAGSGALSATATPSLAVAAVLAGSGVLSATAAPSLTVAAALTGSGALAATAAGNVPVAAALAGSGTLTATVVKGSSAILLGQWGFLDNLLDTSGNGRNGTYNAGGANPLTYVNGPTAGTRAVQFNHAGDFISFGRTGLEPSADGITIMGWMRLTGTPANTFLNLLAKARVSGSSRCRVGLNSGRLQTYAARWKNDLHTNDAATPAVDTGWHHLALVDGNTRWELWVDGVLQTGQMGTRALDNSTSPTWEAFNWTTGRNADIVDQYADPGQSVSGIRIFQGELSATDITTWMNTPITAPPGVYPSATRYPSTTLYPTSS